MSIQSSTNKIIALHPADNVAVALEDVDVGQTIQDLQAAEAIPAGHKIAIKKISAGEPVTKYGFPIGSATADISPGQWVHEHNIQTGLGDGKYNSWTPPANLIPESKSITVQVFNDVGGRTAIRNEVWIVNTVACVNQTATRLAELANQKFLTEFPSIDGFHAFPHPFGCSQLGDDLSTTQKILAGLANHPHAAGVLILGLGCENNRMAEQLKAVDPEKKERIVFFNTQDVGDEIVEGMDALSKLAKAISIRSRTSTPVSSLILGMKCGGSDGYSGITANPVLGRVADIHCAAGGTVLLTEVPEMFGAEDVLLKRCASKEIHADLIAMVDEFKDYFRAHGQPISENPSPGNRDGGISTLEEKSLGCVQKAGSQALIKQIVPYGQLADPNLGGIALINSPGNDGVSTTALTTAGANVILFTTGRGTPLGAPAPTLKVSTNTALAKAKPGWIDFDAGRLLSNSNETLDSLATELYELIVDVAEGKTETQNERYGYREIAIWKTGVTL